MKRRLFNVLAGISLLLCVATAGLWARSYWIGDSLYFGKIWDEGTSWTGNGINVISSRGGLGLNVIFAGPVKATDEVKRDREMVLLPEGWGLGHAHNQRYPLPEPGTSIAFVRLGVVFGQKTWTGRYPEHAGIAILPMWTLVVGFLIIPILRLARFLLFRKRRADGCCHACGYDLRATPDRCPECGTVTIISAHSSKHPAVSRLYQTKY